MADKLMYIRNNDLQNYPLCRLQLEPTKKNPQSCERIRKLKKKRLWGLVNKKTIAPSLAGKMYTLVIYVQCSKNQGCWGF